MGNELQFRPRPPSLPQPGAFKVTFRTLRANHALLMLLSGDYSLSDVRLVARFGQSSNLIPADVYQYIEIKGFGSVSGIRYFALDNLY